jgi:sugar O-acyltransferase (sialic acid O-acetyltransferase NeuD family)
MKNEIVLIGYSGHAYVVADILIKSEAQIIGYCEREEKNNNPFRLKYIGMQTDEHVKNELKKYQLFVAIGDNTVRKRIYENIISDYEFCNAIHPSAIIATHVEIGNATMIGANCIINSCSKIGNGVICNTASIIEHECIIEDFVHLAPNAVLCGNVKVGEGSFIGANAVIKQGITIGKNCIIGAGSVILKNVEDGKTVVGNGKEIIFNGNL